MTTTATPPRHYLVASDFDQTLSFNDSGAVLSELIGASRVRGEGRRPGAQQPRAAGRRAGVPDSPRSGVPRRAARAPRGGRPARPPAAQHPGARRRPRRAASTAIASRSSSSRRRRARSSSPRSTASSRPTTSSAPSSSTTTRPARCGRSGACRPATARWRRSRSSRRGSASRRIARIYVGDGSSDVHVMLHVNNRDGFTIAVSENQQLARIAKSTVLSDDASSVLVPILEQRAAVGARPEIRVAVRVVRPDAAGVGEGADRSRHAARACPPARARRWRDGARTRDRVSGLGGDGGVRRLVFLRARRNAEAGADGGRGDVDRVRRGRSAPSPVVAANLLVLAAAAWTARRAA